MSTNFTSIIPRKLLLSSTPDPLNKEISCVLDSIIPSLVSEATHSCWYHLFGSSFKPNEGLCKVVTLNDMYIAAHPEIASILQQAYHYLTTNGFPVDPHMNGLITYDYYDIDTAVPVETQYAEQICDNDISNRDYHSCMFVVRKDEVKGDHEIYTDSPGMFYEGKKFVLPITSSTTILRSGSQLYTVQPHIGKGKEMSITFHLAVKE